MRERFWVVFDRVDGPGAHEVESRFQFGPGPAVLDAAGAHTAFGDANLAIRSQVSISGGAGQGQAWPERRLEEGQEEPRGGWYSPSYNRIEPAPCLVLGAACSLPLLAATLLWPYRGPDLPPVNLDLGPSGARIALPEGETVVVEATRPSEGLS